MSKITELLESGAGFILIGLGDLYWLWIAIQLGSFGMFVLGVIPIFFVITAPVGAWSLLFGVPDWLASFFWLTARSLTSGCR